MRTVSRMVMGELAKNFVLALGLMTGFLLFEKLFRVIKKIPGLPLAAVGKFFVLLVPSFLPLGIPMALLVAILLSYGRMTMDGEIVALRASGADPWALAGPAVRFGFFCGALALFCSVVLAPESRRIFRETVVTAIPQAIRIEEGVITEAFPGTVLFVGDKVGERDFRKVFLFREAEPNIPAIAIAAERGRLILDDEAGDFRFLLGNGRVHRAQGDGEILLQFGSYDLSLEVPHIQAGKKREETGLAGLLAASRNPALREKERRKAGVELHRRFAWPAACLIFGFIGAPLGAWSGRSGRLGGFVAALGVLFGYYYLLVSGEGIAVRGTLPVVVGVWLPNVVAGAGAALLFRMRSPLR